MHLMTARILSFTRLPVWNELYRRIKRLFLHLLIFYDCLGQWEDRALQEVTCFFTARVGRRNGRGDLDLFEGATSKGY